MAAVTKKWITSRRRKFWASKCQFCGDRWHRAKSNYFIERSEACVQCMSYLAKVCHRGAAWIAQRRGTLQFWDTRLSSQQTAKSRGRRAS